MAPFEWRLDKLPGVAGTFGLTLIGAKVSVIRVC